ncbi:zinc/cadmium/cations transporter [Natrialba hulunbeirensis JCM 10989]|uniref:Zinc/cadmium/cations transporter n=1 Tax=Natrialba hulunbeirensis JCM 10989 TaxID=1227493 RepID=L9ZQ74_9EURY|nr:cation diffusion facilitator family transporter [Natrialba hulunbeirensis]ELY87712.1 zinc/cadmium/cations transporter [Natrialba hulunbeirensis JCM 10989]
MVSTRVVVLVSFGASLAIAVAKFVAYLTTGNVSMLSQTYYSVSDAANQVLLLLGFRLSEAGESRKHPFGRGKEQYFFAFVVTVLLFGIAGFASVREGYAALDGPAGGTNVTINYVVLGVALVFESYAFYTSYHGLQTEREAAGFTSLTATFRHSKDAPLLTAATENIVAVIGVVVAILGVYLTSQTGDPVYDATASIVIGLLLMALALALAWENRSLIVGEGVTRTEHRAIVDAIESADGVAELLDLRTMHLGPDSVLVACDVRFDPDLETATIEQTVDVIEARIQDGVPTADRIYVEAETELQTETEAEAKTETETETESDPKDGE